MTSEGKGLELTRHGVERLRQRGYRQSDVELAMEIGTNTGNAVVVTDRDVDRALADCHRRFEGLERLRGTALILAGDHVLSVYRPRRTKLRRLLRCGRGRGLGVQRHREVTEAEVPHQAVPLQGASEIGDLLGRGRPVASQVPCTM